MLQLHRVQIDTADSSKEVTVLATSSTAACSAASNQVGRSHGTTYLGLVDGVVLGDAPWQMSEAVGNGNYGGS